MNELGIHFIIFSKQVIIEIDKKTPFAGKTTEKEG